MTIVMPMAGRGTRFSQKGFIVPKPFILVSGKPIYGWALDSILDLNFTKLILIALKEHADQFNIIEHVPKKIRERTQLILLDEPTEGQLCTVLASKEYLSGNDDLLIISSDTYVESDIGTAILNQKSKSKGLISVANLQGDRWSFAKTDGMGKVTEVAEKIRISDYASTGLYYFRASCDFITIGKKIVQQKQKQKGEYFIIPIYQEMINRGDYIGISIAQRIIDLGTPEALAEFNMNRRGG
ncbi:MAG: sugar phosphate nucleotidyltransferase [Cyclobacteriaceae bacterium]